MLGLQARDAASARWGGLQFFLLLSSLYVVRPLRDELGIQSGVENMQWLFTGTFIVTLSAIFVYGRIVGRIDRRHLVPVVYGGLAVSLVLLWLLDAVAGASARPWFAATTFIWLSVFNLIAVSLFWSLMADLLEPDQGKRVFGVASAGGSLGALAGP